MRKKQKISDPSIGTWSVPAQITAPWRRARNLGETLALRRGQTLYAQEDPSNYFYLILQGYMKFDVVRRDGSTLLLEIVGEDGVFGEGAAFDRQPRWVRASAVTNVQLVRFDPTTIRQILATDVDLSLSLLALLSAKQRILAHKLTQTTAPSATEKLAELLLRLTDRSAQKTGDPESNTIRLTHDQMAAMIGVTRITVTRILRELAAKGVVVTGHRRVRLENRRPLERLCG